MNPFSFWGKVPAGNLPQKNEEYNMKRSWKIAYTALAGMTAMATLFAVSPASAGTEEYVGEIMLVGYTFCPSGSADAAGQLLAISQNTALFSLYGTTYGGDGITTFALPDLRGRVPKGVGQGPGLSDNDLGEQGGSETHTLTVNEMPSHSHTVRANNLDGDKPGPGNKLLAAAPNGGTGTETIYSDQPSNVTMASSMIANTGGSQAFSTQDPYLVMRYCVVLEGIYPSHP